MPGSTLQALQERMQVHEGELATHEAVCTERYEALREVNVEVKRQLETITSRLGTISDAQVASAAVAAAALTSNRPQWWARMLAAAVIALIGWMGATIWNMQSSKIDALQSRQPATVTVNPAQPQIPPAPIPVSPPSPPADPNSP